MSSIARPHDGLDGSGGNDVLDSADGGRDDDECGSGVDNLVGDAGDVVAGDCENVFGAIVGPSGPQGGPPAQAAPVPAGQRGPRGRVERVRVTRTSRGLRVSAVATRSGRLSVTARHAGRMVGTARRNVRAGKRFTLIIRTRHALTRGRYTLTSTLHADDGRASRATQRLLIR